MKNGSRTSFHLVLFCALIAGAAATAIAQQVPPLLGYQGRVAVSGVNFDGAGLFKFALVNSDGTTTYWSNDGTSTGGQQPQLAVPLTVSKGLYSVFLGDVSLSNMTVLPPSALANADVRLRVWFSDGTHGSQVLKPDQRISSVGYALTAGAASTVADGAITSAKVAAGSIGSAQLSPSLTIGGSFTLGGNLALPATTANTAGVLTLGGVPFLHDFGTQNTFVGSNAGNFTMTGSANTANGHQALGANTTGDGNTAVGQSALGANTTGFDNTAVGAASLYNNLGGNSDSAFGYEALVANTTGTNNTAVGYLALPSNTTGSNNTAVGTIALQSNTTGSSNIALGKGAGKSYTTGDSNIAIGNSGLAGENFTIRIGDVQTSAFIAGISGKTAPSGAAVFVAADGHLGTVTSSRRFKQDIAGMGAASEALLSLQPVCFKYKPELDPKGTAQFGLIAEEVQKIDPDLVLLDDEGKPLTVRYEAVNAMLLNEFLKEHREVERQRAQLSAQHEQIQTLAARLAELEKRMTNDE